AKPYNPHRFRSPIGSVQQGLSAADSSADVISLGGAADKRYSLGSSAMIKIDTSPVRYYSQLDEDAFFAWAQKIPCVTSIEGGFLHIKSKRLSESDLRDLVAIMHRYKIPMQQLRQFCTAANERWFRAEGSYWYKSVFGKTNATQ
ncbi:MAG: hypothetical protein PHH47_11625, partial [Gallionella sp.]|nr:hypothetical protein [Gallionella sp.]MDD4946379.1 hypothetical protein [Gallionella sp.]MDD5612584.1 hypothetical protein [Gallionella sp.]